MHKLDQLYPIDRHWAISEAYAVQAEGVLAAITIEAAEAAARKSKAAQSDEEEPKPYEVVNGTAIFNLSGPMTKKPTSMGWLFGGTSTVMLRDSLRQAASDKSVKQGLLIVDSPGGQAQGTPELADEIRAFSAVKPIAAFADGMAASGAYWALAACDWIGAARMAEVGCIGTYQVVTDSSQAMASAGVKRLVYRAGKFKGAGYPGTEVTPEQHAEFQREVEAINAIFVSDVAALRGMNQDTVAELADGRIHVGQAALDLGLIDCVCTLDECFEMISNGVSPDGKSAASNGTTSQIGARNMADTKPKPGFFARLIGLAKEHGIDVDDAAGGGASLDVPSAAAANAYLDELETKLKKSEAEIATLKAAQTATPTPASQVATPPAANTAVPPATPTSTPDYSVMAGLLVDAQCKDMEAPAKEAALVLAKAALLLDEGKPGNGCEAFATIMATKPKLDMKTQRLMVAQPTSSAKQNQEATKMRKVASAVDKFNVGVNK